MWFFTASLGGWQQGLAEKSFWLHFPKAFNTQSWQECHTDGGNFEGQRTVKQKLLSPRSGGVWIPLFTNEFSFLSIRRRVEKRGKKYFPLSLF